MSSVWNGQDFGFRDTRKKRGPFFCRFCGFVYPTEASRDQHEKLIHPDEPELAS